MNRQLLDCRGLKSPMPIVRASQAMKDMGAGEHLRVISTDPAFRADIQTWAR